MKKLAFWGTMALMAAWAQAQPYSTWSRFRTISVNTATAAVSGTVTNFPLLVRLDGASAATGANVLSEALAGGADIRFTDSTGLTDLPYQIETWTASNAAIWVKVPSISGSATTNIRMYWGKAGQASASNASTVFDTANGYTGVWHLNEASGAATVNDATANGLVFAGNAGVVSVPGIAGTARYYNPGQAGGDNYFIDEATNQARFQAAGVNTRITISGWVNRRGAGSSGSQGIFGQFRYSAGNFRSYALMRDAGGNFNVLTSVDGAADSRRVSTSATFPDNEWQHVVATINPSVAPVIQIWVNGVAQATSGTNTATAAAGVFIATDPGSKPLIGALEQAYQQMCETFVDELQFANGTLRDSNWIKLSYATQKLSPAAVALGVTQSVAPRALFYPLKNANYLLNAVIEPNTPVLSGALTGSYSIAPAASNLPTGISFSTTTGVISGTPTVVKASTQFIITATVGGVVSKDTLTVAVNAGEPPAAPSNVGAVRGNRQATVSWAAPLIVGASPISGYKAMAVSDTSKSCTTTGALTCNVTNLTNGTPYTFVVRASSAAGSSPLSGASLSVTPAGVPGAPTGVVATAVGTTVSVSWTAPVSDSGSPIIEYYCVTVPIGGSCYIGVPAPLNTTVSNLTTGTTYTVAVYAVNGVGQGAASAQSTPVTPTGIVPGSFVIRVSGSAKPFTFVLPEEALTSAEKVTMSISNIYGRTVWSKSVNPQSEKVREMTWNGKSANGRAVSAGMYVVKISTLVGGKSHEFTQKAISIKPL